jgi:D-arabinose 5-phosphate isomerase GutQ
VLSPSLDKLALESKTDVSGESVDTVLDSLRKKERFKEKVIAIAKRNFSTIAHLSLFHHIFQDRQTRKGCQSHATSKKKGN